MIPVEVFTMLGSAIVSGAMSLWSMSMKNKQVQTEMMISQMRAQGELIQAARSDQTERTQWVRTFIAFAGLGAVIVWPKIVPVIAPWVDVWVGWTQWNPGFLFIEGRDVFQWKQMSGLILTPLDTHLVSSIIGFYLGGAVTKR